MVEGPPSGSDLLPSIPQLTIIIPRFTSYEPVIVFPSTSMLISFVIERRFVQRRARRFRSQLTPPHTFHANSAEAVIFKCAAIASQSQ